MKVLLLLLFAVLILATCAGALDNRIVNGEPVSLISQYPYVVSVEVCYNNNNRGRLCNYCTGFIESDTSIGTAAQCFYDKNNRQNLLQQQQQQYRPQIRIQAGSINRQISSNGGGQVRTIQPQNIALPRGFQFIQQDRDGVKYYVPAPTDKATIKLTQQPLILNQNVQPIALGSGRPPVNSTLLVAGWGATDAFNTQQTDILQTLNVTVIPLNECRTYSYQQLSQNNQMCTFAFASGLCPGDAGAPLVQIQNNGGAHRLVGVYSHAALFHQYGNTLRHSCGVLPDIYYTFWP